MNESRKLIWRANIRKTAEKNKGEQQEKVENEVYDEEALGTIYYNVYQLSDELKEYALIQPHGAIIAKGKCGKMRVFTKKVLRKFIEKFLGWYIFPIINQQIVYNQLCSDTLRNVDEIIESQKSQIQNLTKKIEDLETKIEKG